MKVKSEVEIDTSLVPPDYEYLGERPSEELLDKDYIWRAGYTLPKAMKWESRHSVSAPLYHIWRKRKPARVVLEECAFGEADEGVVFGTYLVGELNQVGALKGFRFISPVAGTSSEIRSYGYIPLRVVSVEGLPRPSAVKEG